MKLSCCPELQSREAKMNDAEVFEDRQDTVGWGLLALVWGFTILLDAMPFGAGLVGTGLILLGANVVRYFQGIRINGFSACIGVLALVWGGLELAGTVLPFELPVFAILLIALGAAVVGLEFVRSGANEQPGR